VHPELTSFAQSAGTTLVTLMTTDAWQRTRTGIIQVWRKLQPDRAEIVTAELEATREDSVVAYANGDQEMLDELSAQWQGQLRRLLLARPEALDELRALLDELSPPGVRGTPAVTQHATASGDARVYQAGRDQHITER
jgi:hypothetical protein